MKKTLLFTLTCACLAVPAVTRADFNPAVIKAVTQLQGKVVLYKQAKINGAVAAETWQLFDDDILPTLNSGEVSLDQETLDKRYQWTEITVQATEGEREKIKTGGIQATFYPLHGLSSANPDWLVVYYQALGTIPCSTFHIFRYNGNQYDKGVELEETDFLNEHPNLQWRVIQIVTQNNGRQFSSYFMPVGPPDKINRQQVLWEWKGGLLKPLMWYPEVDRHANKDGQMVPGRGKGFKLR